MKVLLTNGSPHKEGCTYTALCEVSKALNKNGVDTDIFWIGNKPLSGCIACGKCRENNMAFFLQCKKVALQMGIQMPEQEPMIFTNFIR